MRGTAVAATLLLVASLVVVPVGANEPPLAEAGLDQTVSRGATVHLDATGTRDPDGSIASYRWSIETPDGRTRTPACATCPRTRFTPRQVGVFEVTVTVTDDDGAKAADTLFVTVEPGAGPSVSISGPESPAAGSTVTYTATVDAGTARLDRVAWSVDGSVVRVENVSGTHARVSLPHSFGSAGRHEVTARVTDADGQRAADSLFVNARGAGGGGNGSAPGGGNGTPSIADGVSPEVLGPQLLTGAGPFEGDYRVAVDTDRVSEVQWWRNGRRAATGMRSSVDWSAGEHDLYAVVTYADGSTDAARFPDGTTAVTVDPEPNVSLSGLQTAGTISGFVTGTDAFENLRRIGVAIDGETVASRAVSPVKLRAGTAGKRLDLSFGYPNVTPDRPYNLTVTAVDARGQRRKLERTVRPTGEPEILRSEFVNGPVDSYHPRLDPDRYVAHHVLKVDLNGVDPEEVLVTNDVRGSRIMEFDNREIKIYHDSNSTMVVHSFWAGEIPSNYFVEFELGTKNRGVLSRNHSLFSVTPSPPEIRFEVVSGGTPHQKTEWGIVVDASESFDPDGTDLKYIWLGGAEAITPDNSTAKFDSFALNGLRVEDEYNLTSTVPADAFLDYFNPGVEEVKKLDNGPFKPNETVRFVIRTNPYKLPKFTYYDKFDIELRSEGGEARISEWKEKRLMVPSRELRNHHVHYGTVRVKASEFDGPDDPYLVLYNTEAPEETAQVIELPDVRVLEKGKRYVSDVTVLDASYLVERPIRKHRTTTLESERDYYLSQGYKIMSVTESGTKYVLERRVQTQEAEYETETVSFQQRGRRNTFLAINPDWERGPTTERTKRWTTEETEWRDSKGGKGTFLGQTKEVIVESAEYRTEQLYRRQVTVWRTGTRTVTRTTTIRTKVVRQDLELDCGFGGCTVKRRSYTEWVTRTIEYQIQETYKYPETKTETYWSFVKKGPNDEFLGETRRVKVEEAVTETRYLYQYEKQHSETKRYYTAEKTEQVQAAKYEWQKYKTTKSEIVAKTDAMLPDVRIASKEPARKWLLVKENGTEEVWRSGNPDPSDVLETKATVKETIVQTYRDPKWDIYRKETIGTRIRTFRHEGYLQNSDIISQREGKIVEE